MSDEELEKESCCCCEECSCGEECDCDEEKCCEECSCCHEKSCECEDCDCCEDEDFNCENCECGNCKCEDCDCEDCNCECEDSQGEGIEQEESQTEETVDNEEQEEPVSNDAEKYLNLAKQIQADFDNFRRRSIEENKQARLNGQTSVLEVFLPCLDTFKEAKKSITDENVLKGVEMIENRINEALKVIGVEKIESIGQVYNPHLHNVIAVMKNPDEENDIILEEYQAGYKLNDKIIRYAKVIVNKKED